MHPAFGRKNKHTTKFTNLTTTRGVFPTCAYCIREEQRNDRRESAGRKTNAKAYLRTTNNLHFTELWWRTEPLEIG